MSKQKKRKCLLIQTRDSRKFLTHEENLQQLIEFSKTFGAEISVVKIKEGEILDLVDLVPAICNKEYKTKLAFELLEKKIESPSRRRKDILKQATRIRGYITREFLKGNIVSLREVRRKFASENLTLACYCNHLSESRKHLMASGFNIQKVGGGKYQLVAKEVTKSAT